MKEIYQFCAFWCVLDRQNGDEANNEQESAKRMKNREIDSPFVSSSGLFFGINCLCTFLFSF
jgi:hypothetical protein